MLKTLKKTNQIRKRRLGQGMVEFALVMPVFLVMTLGIIELGHAYFTYSSLTNAVRDGARFAIVDPNNTNGIKNKVISSGYLTGLTQSNVSVITPGGQSVQDPGGPITVTATYNYQPLLNIIIPNVTFNASSVMIVEEAP